MWDKLKDNKGFFMPSVTIFLLFLFTFIGFQVIQVVDFQKLIIAQQKHLQLYSIKNQVYQYVKHDLKTNNEKLCIIPTTYKHQKFGNQDVYIKKTCIRDKPPKHLQQTLLTEYQDMKIFYDQLLRGRSNITNPEIDIKRVLLATIASIQINDEWIGLPVDFDSLTPEALMRYTAIYTIPFLNCYTFDIKYQNKNYAMMVFANANDQKITNIYFT